MSIVSNLVSGVNLSVIPNSTATKASGQGADKTQTDSALPATVDSGLTRTELPESKRGAGSDSSDVVKQLRKQIQALQKQLQAEQQAMRQAIAAAKTADEKAAASASGQSQIAETTAALETANAALMNALTKQGASTKGNVVSTTA